MWGALFDVALSCELPIFVGAGICQHKQAMRVSMKESGDASGDADSPVPPVGGTHGTSRIYRTKGHKAAG